MSRNVLFGSTLLAAVLSAVVGAGCAAPADGADPAHQDDVSETQQAVQTCTSTCTAWGGKAVSCTSPTGTCSADGNGVTCDGTTIPCSCANLAVTVTTSPVGYASNQTATWTAHPSGGSGNYTYTWKETWCRNGTAPHDCDGSSNTTTSTTPTKSLYVSTYMFWDKYCVSLHDNACPAYGNAGPACATVTGDGTCPPGKICPQ